MAVRQVAPRDGALALGVWGTASCVHCGASLSKRTLSILCGAVLTTAADRLLCQSALCLSVWALSVSHDAVSATFVPAATAGAVGFPDFQEPFVYPGPFTEHYEKTARGCEKAVSTAATSNDLLKAP